MIYKIYLFVAEEGFEPTISKQPPCYVYQLHHSAVLDKIKEYTDPPKHTPYLCCVVVKP